MAKMIPIVITMLRIEEKFLFLKRVNPPYESLWGLVGGKVEVGEHIPVAAVREVLEETGASKVDGYHLKGMVSERLVTSNGELLAHFLLFVGDANISEFVETHREGELALFSAEEILGMKNQVVPSDFEMFFRMKDRSGDSIVYHEVELIQNESTYQLGYYRDGGS